ncbi:MAG: hypothetical protein NTW67_04530 [Candidatus Woesearchaeota archaeon]|nr:hypothetical protein [Candidatus Woesearchaeota archaeon]
MSEQYTKEDVALLRKELMAIMRRRVIAQAKLTFLWEEEDLERKCRIGDEPEESFVKRGRSICKWDDKAAEYVQKEMEAYDSYVDACWLYQMETGKPL